MGDIAFLNVKCADGNKYAACLSFFLSGNIQAQYRAVQNSVLDDKVILQSLHRARDAPRAWRACCFWNSQLG